MNGESWIHKYMPKKIADIQGQNKVVEQVLYFVKNFKQQKKKALLLYGDSGSGKTTIAHAVANELDLEILEVNASDVRNAEHIREVIGRAATQMSLFGKGKIILVDEIDGVSGTKDRGGVTEIVKIIASTAFPIIMTANNPYDKKFSSLRSKAELVGLTTLSYLSIAAYLKKIVDAEQVVTDDDCIKALARRAGGDMRAAINDLQNLSTDGKLTKDDLAMLDDREHEESIINALMRIFKTTQIDVAKEALRYVGEDYNEVMLWIDHNLPEEYEKPEDLYNAYRALSNADIMNRRIRRRQHWRFLVYVNAFLSSGVALAKEEKYKKFVSYKPTMRLLKIWQANQKYAKRKAIAEKISLKTHCSIKDAIKSSLPYYQFMFSKSKAHAQAIADYLELDKEEVAWLSKA